jgi:hypothetical protein
MNEEWKNIQSCLLILIVFGEQPSENFVRGDNISLFKSDELSENSSPERNPSGENQASSLPYPSGFKTTRIKPFGEEPHD